MGAEITKVTLKLGKREIEMTVEEAKSLKAALEGLFGQLVVKETVREGCTHWHWEHAYPIYRGGAGTSSPMWAPPYEITCQAENGAVGSTLCLDVKS